MPYLQSVDESDLRGMAREATTLHLNQGIPLGDAVVKVASSFDRPLTSEHVRRVCEMSYHDTFERSFKGAGPSRVVSFDPADAEKVAQAVQAKFIESHKDKLASAAEAPGQEEEKVASAGFTPPAPKNAFLEAMASYESNDEVAELEKKAEIRQAREAMKSAVEAMENRVGSTKLAEWYAYRELGQAVRQEVIEGVDPTDVLTSCAAFMKQASIDDDIISGVISQLSTEMVEGGVEFTKQASLDFHPNPDHPLRAKALQVGQLRGEKIAGEIALDDLRHRQELVEYEFRRTVLGDKVAGISQAALGGVRAVGNAVKGVGKATWAGANKLTKGNRLAATGLLGASGVTAAASAPDVGRKLGKNVRKARAPWKGVT